MPLAIAATNDTPATHGAKLPSGCSTSVMNEIVAASAPARPAALLKILRIANMEILRSNHFTPLCCKAALHGSHRCAEHVATGDNDVDGDWLSPKAYTLLLDMGV